MSKKKSPENNREFVQMVCGKWMKKHSTWSPEEMVQRIMMIMSKGQLEELLGASSFDDEDDGRLEGRNWITKESDIHGNGIFSKGDYPKNEELFVTLNLSHLKPTLTMNHLNHSDDPNVYLDLNGRDVVARALREIEEGEEFTISYYSLPAVVIFDNKIPSRKTGGRVPPIPGRDIPEEA